MKQKTSFKERLVDACLELIISAVCLIIGAGLFLLFGKNPWELDFETLALVGVGIFLAAALAVGALVYLIKKKKKEKKTNEPS